MTPASQWCEMLSLFLPFKQQPVKSPQFNKGVSAQCTRVLGRSTLSVSKHGWTRTNRGGRTRNTVEMAPAIPAHQPQQLRRRCRQQEPPSHHATTATGKWVPCHRDTHDALCLQQQSLRTWQSQTWPRCLHHPAPYHLPLPLCFRSPQPKRSWAWWKSPLSGAPASHASDTSSNKAPLIHPGGRRSGDNEGPGPSLWQRPWKVKSADSQI